MAYARGNHANAHCDGCSRVFRYLDLRPQARDDGSHDPAVRVCEDCYDEPVRHRKLPEHRNRLRHPRPSRGTPYYVPEE